MIYVNKIAQIQNLDSVYNKHKISQIQNIDSLYNLVNPSPHTRLLFYVYFYVISGTQWK